MTVKIVILRRKKEEGRRKKEEGRITYYLLPITYYLLPIYQLRRNWVE
ncbi:MULTISPECIES: hypothetical protein [unclassified Microcoleus]